jgi:uncharacterized phiE125 gp8 family phage protein
MDPKQTAIVVSNPPAVEPVALSDMKNFLGVQHSEHDALITGLIVAARRHAEVFTRRAFITTSFVQYHDTFPRGSTLRIKLLRPNCKSVDRITFVGADDITQTVGFLSDTISEIASVFPPEGYTWPCAQCAPEAPNAVEIHFTAGYGDAATDVPQGIITAIMVLVQHWYKERDNKSDDRLSQTPMAVEALLWDYRLRMYGPSKLKQAA